MHAQSIHGHAFPGTIVAIILTPSLGWIFRFVPARILVCEVLSRRNNSLGLLPALCSPAELLAKMFNMLHKLLRVGQKLLEVLFIYSLLLILVLRTSVKPAIIPLLVLPRLLKSGVGPAPLPVRLVAHLPAVPGAPAPLSRVQHHPLSILAAALGGPHTTSSPPGRRSLPLVRPHLRLSDNPSRGGW